MRRRIFQSIFLACFITLVLTTACVTGVIYHDSTQEIKKEVMNQTLYISTAIELSDDGIKYISTVGKESDNRITLISSDGTVIYDNYVLAETLENHYNRPEIQDAVTYGKGELTRLSETLGEKTYYYAIYLNNGMILRVACTIKSVIGLMNSAFFWVVLIALIVLFISVLIARIITNSIVKPINNLNLNNPLLNNTYEELSPLLTKIEKQNQKIKSQFDELSARQKEFDYITESMNEGLIIFSENGTVLSANKSAKKILGDITGKSYLQICRDMNYIKAIESARNGKPSVSKTNINGKVYQLSANPVENNLKSYAAVLFIIDITDKEQIEKMRHEFSANVSHELKTPLTSILGYAEIIEKGVAKKEDIPRFATQIHTEAARLLTLIDDIIRLSRLDEGNLNQEITEIELSQLCKSVINELLENAKNKNVKVSFEGVPVVISGYRSVLHEMVYNLCDNAIKYNNENGSVVVKLIDGNNKIKLSVSDTGIGIAPEHHERIFERFYRVDKSHSKDTGGTGLGLSIVKHAALLHDAKISLESQPGIGTTITIIFNK